MKALTVAKSWLGSRDARIAHLKLAVVSSSAAKVARLLTQTTIVGITVRYLGIEQYGLWLTVVSALGWLSWGQAGLAPGLTNAIARAEGQGRIADQGVYFTTAIAVVTAIVVVIFLVGNALLAIGAPVAVGLLGASGTDTLALGSRLVSFLPVALALALLRFPLVLVESAYTGLQSVHVLRMWEIVGQILCVVAVAGLAYAEVRSPLFLLGAGIAAECGVIGAGLFLVLSLKPHLRPSLSKIDLRACRGMLDLSIAYLVLQVAGYLVTNTGTLMLAAFHGPGAVPLFALTMQLYQMASGVWMMFIMGLWGALAEARAVGDWPWIKRAQRQIVLGSMALSIAYSIVLAFGGNWILDLWSGGRVTADRIFLVVTGVMCSVFTWAVIHAQIMNALGFVWIQARAAMANGLLVLALGLLLIPRLGVTGLSLALLLAVALSTAWVYPLLLRRTTEGGSNVPA